MARSNRRKPQGKRLSRQWRRMDLHIHTPGSNDYLEEGVTYLDILRQAEIRGLDIIAFTDHNTVAGFAAMKKEIEQLLWLDQRGRMEPAEEMRLAEYRRLLGKIMVLPGFEFTATFGFHILGIFPSETAVTYLEHLLLTLHVPADQLQEGNPSVGATSDVLTAYQVINDAGGIVIGAHANSKNGVAMRGLDFGGQTRIAYTQDRNLHLLEVTDLEKRGRYTTRRFFDGSKPEYPRPMRCIQGSDAHVVTRESATAKRLGVGDRITEVLLPDVSFKSLADVLKGKDFSLTRPYRGPANPIDFVQLAREEGESIVQSFHASAAQRGGNLNRILEDVCAMANGNGGTIYIGASANQKEAPVGVREHKAAIERLYTAIKTRFSPEPEVHIDNLPSKAKQIVRINVHAGSDAPYAIDDNKFYVRDEAETNLAVRDEIVRLVSGVAPPVHVSPVQPVVAHAPSPSPSPKVPSPQQPQQPQQQSRKAITPPRTGVEVVDSDKRQGTVYHTLRDLRNGNAIKNVTKKSARKLWHYAITEVEAGNPKPKSIKWQGDIALLDKRQKQDNVWYDLALRDGDTIHVYYGVTDSGLNEDWLALVNGE